MNIVRSISDESSFSYRLVEPNWTSLNRFLRLMTSRRYLNFSFLTIFVIHINITLFHFCFFRSRHTPLRLDAHFKKLPCDILHGRVLGQLHVSWFLEVKQLIFAQLSINSHPTHSLLVRSHYSPLVEHVAKLDVVLVVVKLLIHMQQSPIVVLETRIGLSEESQA